MTRGGMDCGGETPRAEEGGEKGFERPTLRRPETMAEGEEEDTILWGNPNC